MTHKQLDRSVSLPRLGGEDGGCDVLHVDMDSFFASVELLDRPELIGQPVIVGGHGGRGVVTSATYEARAFGVHSAMPMSRATRLCPQAVVIEPSHGKYGQVSQQVMELLGEFTPTLQVLSVDEAFLDVRSVHRLHGSSTQIASKIRQSIKVQLGLPCSVGVGTTTSVAKIASTLAKPDGLLVVPASQTREFLRALPVSKLWGVGEATQRSLRSIGVLTVADLELIPASSLAAAIGKASAARLSALASGQEVQAVSTQRAERSISAERTFDFNVHDIEAVRRKLREESVTVLRRLRGAGLVARTVSCKLRFADFETVERSHTLRVPSCHAGDIDPVVDQLLEALWRDSDPIRLVGVRVSGLLDAARTGEQLSLDDVQSARGIADDVADQVASRFGHDAVLPARLLNKRVET